MTSAAIDSPMLPIQLWIIYVMEIEIDVEQEVGYLVVQTTV
jgi:hypothetical protein